MATTIARESLLSLEAYSKIRKPSRAEAIAHRRQRTVALGEHITLQFEDERTIRRQIQEMLLIEKIFDEEGIRSEIEAHAGDLVTLIGQNLPFVADDLCFLAQAADGQQIPIDILSLQLVGGGAQVRVNGRIPFVPQDAPGKQFVVMIGEGKGIRRAVVPDFPDVQVLQAPWAWAGEPPDMAVWPVAVNPAFTPPVGPCFTSLPPQDGKICIFLNQDWAQNSTFVIGARIHKPCDRGHDINFGGVRFTGGGTKFDCAVRICDLLKKAFEARGRKVRCNVTADPLGNAKIVLQCTGPDKLNAGYISVCTAAALP